MELVYGPEADTSQQGNIGGEIDMALNQCSAPRLETKHTQVVRCDWLINQSDQFSSFRSPSP